MNAIIVTAIKDLLRRVPIDRPIDDAEADRLVNVVALNHGLMPKTLGEAWGRLTVAELLALDSTAA